jgi:hypothetical protein
LSNQSSAIVQRLWNYCTVLRDDGLSYGDYVEQLTCLLFLKMGDETSGAKSAILPKSSGVCPSSPPPNKPSPPTCPAPNACAKPSSTAPSPGN